MILFRHKYTMNVQLFMRPGEARQPYKHSRHELSALPPKYLADKHRRQLSRKLHHW